MKTYKRHRFRPDIISYAVWLYYGFSLSHRDIEDLLAERGFTVSHESIRLWCKSSAPYIRGDGTANLNQWDGLLLTSPASTCQNGE